MIVYKFTFINGEPITVNQAHFDALMGMIEADIAFELRGFTDETGTIIVNPNHIVSIVSLKVSDTQQTVVTPPSPAALRAQQADAEANKDVSLDAQLSGEV